MEFQHSLYDGLSKKKRCKCIGNKTVPKLIDRFGPEIVEKMDDPVEFQKTTGLSDDLVRYYCRH